MVKNLDKTIWRSKEDRIALAIDSNDNILLQSFTYSNFEGNNLVGDIGTKDI